MSKVRISTDGALFQVRYLKHGQDLKHAMTTWMGQQMSSNLSQLRLKRLADDAAMYEHGMQHMESWATIRRAITDFRTATPTGTSEHIDKAVLGLNTQCRTCCRFLEKKFDDLIASICFTIDSGKLACDAARLDHAQESYQLVPP